MVNLGYPKNRIIFVDDRPAQRPLIIAALRLYSLLGVDVAAILSLWLFTRSIRLTQSPRVAEAQYGGKFKLKFVRILMTHPVHLIKIHKYNCAKNQDFNRKKQHFQQNQINIKTHKFSLTKTIRSVKNIPNISLRRIVSHNSSTYLSRFLAQKLQPLIGKHPHPSYTSSTQWTSYKTKKFDCIMQIYWWASM